MPPAEAGQDGHMLAKLKQGDILGEIDLFLNEPRSCDAWALTYVEMRVLLKEHFDRICSDHPKVSKKLQKLVLQRKSRFSAVSMTNVTGSPGVLAAEHTRSSRPSLQTSEARPSTPEALINRKYSDVSDMQSRIRPDHVGSPKGSQVPAIRIPAYSPRTPVDCVETPISLSSVGGLGSREPSPVRRRKSSAAGSGSVRRTGSVDSDLLRRMEAPVINSKGDVKFQLESGRSSSQYRAQAPRLPIAPPNPDVSEGTFSHGLRELESRMGGLLQGMRWDVEVALQQLQATNSGVVGSAQSQAAPSDRATDTSIGTASDANQGSASQLATLILQQMAAMRSEDAERGRKCVELQSRLVSISNAIRELEGHFNIGVMSESEGLQAWADDAPRMI